MEHSSSSQIFWEERMKIKEIKKKNFTWIWRKLTDAAADMCCCSQRTSSIIFSTSATSSELTSLTVGEEERKWNENEKKNDVKVLTLCQTEAFLLSLSLAIAGGGAGALVGEATTEEEL